MNLYLVENYNTSQQFDKGSLVISLAPKVCYEMDKAGIKYSIIEDYYSEDELNRHEEDYHISQFRWIKDLDDFLQNEIPELKKLGLRLGDTYYYFLKTMVLDPLYISCYTLNKVFKTIKPSSVVYCVAYPTTPTIDYTLRDGDSYDSQIFTIICQIICQRDKIPFRLELCKPEGDIVKKPKWVVRNWLYSKYDYYCHKFPLITNGGKDKPLKILVLKSGHRLDCLVHDALKSSNVVYQLLERGIGKYTLFGLRNSLNVNNCHISDNVVRGNIRDNVADILERSDLIKRLNDDYQVDVSGIVIPRLKYFISRICPEIVGYYKAFIEYYNKEVIDYVITTQDASPMECSAVLASRHSNNTKCINLYHGAEATANKMWDITELSHFNIVVAPSIEQGEYFKSRCKINNAPTVIQSSLHQFQDIVNIRQLRQSRKGSIGKNILYLSNMLNGECRRLDGVSYPDTWYYKFQEAIVDYLAIRTDYTFIWKSLPTSDAIYNPILDYIRDNDLCNIEIDTGSFIKHLPTIGRVICDYPSTGFYESIIAGVPTMSLYKRGIHVRETALRYFGAVLKPFSDAEEAIENIDAFLDNDTSLYTMDVKADNKSLLQILKDGEL